MDLYVITGASRGIGWSLVREAAKAEGTEILAISRSGLPSPVPGSRDLKFDLRTRAGQSASSQALAAALAEKRWSRAVLVNNAGMVEPVGPLERIDIGLLAEDYELNVIAPVALMQAFIKASAGIASRSVINISSGAGRLPRRGWTAYCSAKAALDMVSLVAVAEAKADGTGVRVTSLAPGLVDTAMQGVVRGHSAADFPSVGDFLKWKAEGTLQDPDKVAAKILRLEREGRMPEGLAALAEL